MERGKKVSIHILAYGKGEKVSIRVLTPSVTLEGKDYPIKRILYEADIVIAGEEDLLKIETLALRKGKIEEDERLIYDNLVNIVVIELIEDDNETIISDNYLEMMEDEVSTATSHTPFTRTQPIGVRQDRGGNVTPQIPGVR